MSVCVVERAQRPHSWEKRDGRKTEGEVSEAVIGSIVELFLPNLCHLYFCSWEDAEDAFAHLKLLCMHMF